MKAIRIKKITYALCLALMASVLVSNRCVAQFSIPDSNFKAYLQETIPKAFDASGNLITTSQEVTSLDTIKVMGQGIKSLDGIEFFTSLKILYCYRNQLTSLDISQNAGLKELYCSDNQLTSLDVSKNTDLQRLDCTYNQLTSLDVSKNTALTDLYCPRNQLTSLDVSKNTALTSLNCNNNQITSLDVSKNIALLLLNCFSNQLTNLDISKNTALTGLDCEHNHLSSLDVSKNTALTELYCQNNQLTSLDVSKNRALIYLICFNNQLTSLDVSKNIALEYLNCGDNQITSLDMRGIRKNRVIISGKEGADEYEAFTISNNPLKKLLIHTNMKDNEFIKDVKTDRGDALIISTYSAEEGSDNYTLKCANYNPNTGVCKKTPLVGKKKMTSRKK